MITRSYKTVPPSTAKQESLSGKHSRQTRVPTYSEHSWSRLPKYNHVQRHDGTVKTAAGKFGALAAIESNRHDCNGRYQPDLSIGQPIDESLAVYIANELRDAAAMVIETRTVQGGNVRIDDGKITSHIDHDSANRKSGYLLMADYIESHRILPTAWNSTLSSFVP